MARGFTGAFDTLRRVELVLVLAEPGNPGDDETFEHRSGAKIVDDIRKGVRDAITEGATKFHRNVQRVLNCCWPEFHDDVFEQLSRTWITESVLCSAPVTTGRISKAVESACGEMFLKKQLALFKEAFVVALGSKANARLGGLGFSPDFVARAPAPPGGNSPEAERSWRSLGRAFLRYRIRKA